MATPALFDARAYLQDLVGQTIPTITGRPNTIVAVRGDDVFVRTESTADPAGEAVPIQWVQDAGDTLHANGRIGINTTEATHRSAFIGAVLSTLPGAAGLRRPARVELVGGGNEVSTPPGLERGARPSASRPTKRITRSSARSTISCTRSNAQTSKRFRGRSTCGRRDRMDHA